ncbi:MAG: type IV pilus twitching motility protein PilT [Pseudomonadota bacterium]|nr:type IV pilus twitching motility protein PilT [Pseudomonadota bacterium]
MDLASLCRLAMTTAASDIHLKVGMPPMLRIHGEIQPVANLPALTNDELAKAMWDIMSPVQRERFKATNDCDLAHTVPGVARFRCNVFRSQQRIGAVLRAIPSQVKTIDELQLPAVLKKVAREPRGMILVTGSTGSGKSTTLAAIIEEINRNLPHHILTIEDPIEFVFQDQRCVVNQREVGLDAPNFHQALRSALRQDPDVILIGELRDLETVEIAMHAAETGHLVLATLHTIDAHETINRIVGFFEPHQQQQIRLQLGSVLRAVVSQRLVPATSGGRVAALEIMLNTGTVYECIVDGSRTREVRDHIRKGRAQYGMQTFDQALYEHIQSGRVQQDQGLRFANNPDEVALRLSGLTDDSD